MNVKQLMYDMKRVIRDYKDLEQRSDTEKEKKHYKSVGQGLKLAEHFIKLENTRSVA